MKSMYLRAHWEAPSRRRVEGMERDVAHLEKAEAAEDMVVEEVYLDHRFDWVSRMVETVWE